MVLCAWSRRGYERMRHIVDALYQLTNMKWKCHAVQNILLTFWISGAENIEYIAHPKFPMIKHHRDNICRLNIVSAQVMKKEKVWRGKKLTRSPSTPVAKARYCPNLILATPSSQLISKVSPSTSLSECHTRWCWMRMISACRTCLGGSLLKRMRCGRGRRPRMSNCSDTF